MPTLTFSLCLLACFLSFTVSTEITVKPGENDTLQCLSTSDANITLLEWSRPDLNPKTDGYVFFFRDDRLYEDYQYPSFRGRVQLRDREMKDGDVSVILKNVTINDTGTYKCRVSVKSKERRKRATPELVCIINLKVEDSGHTAGNTWTEGDKDEGKTVERNHGTVGLPVAVVLVVAVIVGFVIHRQRRQRPD